MNHQIVQDALENAAGADDAGISGVFVELGGRTTPSGKRISGAREVIKRFLEDLPSEITAEEILEELN